MVYSGVIMGLNCGHLMIHVGSKWGHCWVNIGYRVIIGSLWGQHGVSTLGLALSHLWVIVESSFGQPRVTVRLQ